MKKNISLPKKKEIVICKKRTDENTWGDTVIKILIYLKFLFQIFVRSVNL